MLFLKITKMQVLYEVKDSVHEGKGVFAQQKIKKGTLVWKRILGINAKIYTKESSFKHCATISETERNRFLDVAYGDGNDLVFTWDDSQYFNHSNFANCGGHETEWHDPHCYAIKDIEIGQELLEDYRDYDHTNWMIDLYNKYTRMPDFYDVPTPVETVILPFPSSSSSPSFKISA